MTNTILVTDSAHAVGSSEEVVVRQLLEKDINFLKLGAFSKVTLTFQETMGSKPITLGKFEEDYAQREVR
ncbi:MAG TPA: hypothetical protein VN239_01180 [Nitrososphaera sp.]|jgi:hypothetical protein|nr:hypothetical protein [Nitrososphaera sp.]